MTINANQSTVLQNGHVKSSGDAAEVSRGKDPRYLALRNFALSLTIFNIIGYTLLGFEQPWMFPIISVLVAYTLELLLETVAAWGENRRPGYRGRGVRGFYEFLLPAHITGLAVNFLLYANDRVWPVVFGVSVAIGAKWVLRARIRGRVRHFMNPSNFGISVALLVYANISIAPPYHFVEHITGTLDWVLPALIVTGGTMLNAKLTRKMPLIIAWIGGFALQAIIRGLLTDISIVSALSPMVGLAFVLFSNYMITDPATTPFRKRDQVIFGGGVAAAYGVLTALHIAYGMFFAVTIICLVRGVYWWIRSGREWFESRRSAASSQPVSRVTETVVPETPREGVHS